MFLHVVITCPLLIDSPNNGMINCSLGDDGQPNPGDTCSYTCNTGFVLDGNTIRTCQNDATWSDTEPFCRPGMLFYSILLLGADMQEVLFICSTGLKPGQVIFVTFYLVTGQLGL